MTNHSISQNEAVTMTSRFRANRESILTTEFRGRDVLPISETFDRGAVLDLLNTANCESLRIYFGMDNENRLHAILVAADNLDADILPDTDPSQPTDALIENGMRCPTSCPPRSVLNED